MSDTYSLYSTTGLCFWKWEVREEKWSISILYLIEVVGLQFTSWNFIYTSAISYFQRIIPPALDVVHTTSAAVLTPLNWLLWVLLWFCRAGIQWSFINNSLQSQNSSRSAKGSSSLDRLYSRKIRKQLVHHKQVNVSHSSNNTTSNSVSAQFIFIHNHIIYYIISWTVLHDGKPSHHWAVCFICSESWLWHVSHSILVSV